MVSKRTDIHGVSSARIVNPFLFADEIKMFLKKKCFELNCQACNYLFNVNNGNTRALCEVFSKLTIKDTRTTSFTSFRCI